MIEMYVLCSVWFLIICFVYACLVTSFIDVKRARECKEKDNASSASTPCGTTTNTKTNTAEIVYDLMILDRALKEMTFYDEALRLYSRKETTDGDN